MVIFCSKNSSLSNTVTGINNNLANNSAQALVQKINIVPTTDANTLIATGWHFAGGGTGGTSYNFPTNSSGLLEVFNISATFYIQRYTPYTGSPIYVRGYFSGSGWGAWKAYTGV